MESKIEVAIAAHANLAEGVMWHEDEHVLYWLDIMAGLVHRFDPATSRNTTINVGRPVGVVRPRRAGGLVMGIQGGFAALDTQSGQWEMLAEVPGASGPDMRMNDGSCDAAGRFWAGTMGIEEAGRAGKAALYRLDPDGSVHQMIDGVTISNGIGWSPDNRLMYYIDTPTGGVDVFDYDLETGSIANRRRLITINGANGSPDGMTVDGEGYLWVALYGGWAVRRFRPDGTLEREVRLPTAHVTCPTFGGEDLSTLYISTAAENLTDQQRREQPQAGDVFRCIPGVTGVPAYRFEG